MELHLGLYNVITTKSMPALTIVIVFGHCFYMESNVRKFVINPEDLVGGRS